jgi:AcrR family transcriptional regulator
MTKAAKQVPRVARLGVTRDRIGEMALKILDDATDESALTMRALARELGVQAPSLYAHVTGIADVFELVHARINASIDLTVLDDPDPLRGLRAFAVLYREAYRRHVVAATVIITRSINANHALTVYEAAAACLLRAGVPVERIMSCLALLDTLALGSAIEPFAAGFVGASSSYRPGFPTLADALRHSRRRHLDDDGFTLGLDTYIDLVSSLAAPVSRPAAARRG